MENSTGIGNEPLLVEKKRGKWNKVFDKEDKDYLERAFAVNPYPSKEDVEHFTKTTEKTCAQIRTWFSFRRQTEKKVNPEFAQLKESKVKMHPAEMFTEDDFNFLKRAFDENSYPSKEDIDSFNKNSKAAEGNQSLKQAVRDSEAGQEDKDNNDYESDDSDYEIIQTRLTQVTFHPDYKQVYKTPEGEFLHVKERDLVFEDK
ncbi:Oidioi.mRNA.OKI2018_I69.XSR.g14130.t1.cds [Oikopleura dioica]|uniref:Oidioi.mRNA.OKI2018_I69.XSR.g14130.t1.cds n=1 Tax=Oikopleura dioica TaxID=34765 RepID=A0ABN7SHN3_OIKDI|nr:Oidioi.mRNA.OKI2018_I69.XSR.g14130.t1.cds [Oikopleura dioica]